MKKLLKDLEALRDGMAAGRGFDQMRFESPEVSALARDLLRHYARQDAVSKAKDRSLKSASASLSKVRLEKEQFKSSLGELQKILDLCRVISSAQDLKDILHHLLFLLSEILPSRGCAVFVGRDGAPGASPLLSSNFTPRLKQDLAQHMEEGIIRWAMAERRVCLIPSFDASEPGGYAAIPLLDNDGEFGFIWIACTVPHDEVTPETVNLVWVLSSHASVAILNCLHRQRMEEKINELRILTSINSLKDDILRQGIPREDGGGAATARAEAARPDAGRGEGGLRAEGGLPVFYAELLKLLARELKLERGHLILSNPDAVHLGASSGPNASSQVPGGAGSPPGTLTLQPPHPVLGDPLFLDHPETRKLLRQADREQVRLEAGDFFASSYPSLSKAFGSEGLAALSLTPPDGRSSARISAWLLLPLSGADLQRIPMVQTLLMAIVSQARVVAENVGLYDSLLAANRNLTSLQWQLVHSGKMAALGQLAGGVAHEINNPLQIMLGRIQMVQMMAEDKKAGSKGKIKQEIDLVTEEILRIRDIVRNLLDFSRQGKREASYAPVSVNDMVKDVLALLDHQLRDSQVTVELDLDASNPRILGNRNQLKQVFINLMMNAVHAMEKDPKVMVVRSVMKDGLVQASIRDSGIGIPKENISRIFEPFFSTKAMGTGLGLSISYGLVKDHKGTMEVESIESHGTCFTVTLPKLADEAMGYNLLVG